MALQDISGLVSQGGIFNVNRAQWSDTDTNGDGQRNFTLRAKNTSGDWVDVVVDRNFGNVSTGHFNDGTRDGLTESLQVYLGRTVKITRWRPGAFGVPGNGGGQILFLVPFQAFDVIVDIDVIG